MKGHDPKNRGHKQRVTTLFKTTLTPWGREGSKQGSPPLRGV